MNKQSPDGRSSSGNPSQPATSQPATSQPTTPQPTAPQPTAPQPAPPQPTVVIAVDPLHPADADLLPAAELLRTGQLVAFPTETVYGLGADALNPDAVRAIFAAKGRPADNPLIIHVASLAELRAVTTHLPDQALPLVERFMPGPLTLVLPRAPHVPDVVTAGLDTVAVRMPEHPVARRLIELAGVPVAAPSANRSGRPSPTTAGHVLEDMDGRIPLIVDGGPCDFGVESTVLDVTGSIPVILRPGAVTIEELRSVAGIVWTIEEAAAAVRHARETACLEPAPRASGPADACEPVAPAGQAVPPEPVAPAGMATPSEPVAPAEVPRSPGMKYRHYAPRTPLRIAEGERAEDRAQCLVERVLAAIADGSRPAVFASGETAAQLQAALPAGWRLAEPERDAPGEAAGKNIRGERTICTIVHGPRGQARTAASRLFAALRQLDTCGADVIIAEGAESAGIGAAYMNRLRKAAGGGPEPLGNNRGDRL